MDKVLVFDLLTKKSYDDVGGKKGIDKMGIAIAGLYDYKTSKLTIYKEENISILIKELFCSVLVVGVSLKKFNYKILSSFSQNDFSQLKSLDILEHFKKKLSFKPTLEGLLNATLGLKKAPRNGIYISRLYKQDKIEEIQTLCEEKIFDLKNLYDFGKEKGHIFYNDNTGQRWKISVHW